MKIDLDSLGREPHQFEAVFTDAEIAAESGTSFPNGVQVKGRIDKTEGRIVVSGTIAALVNVDCTRCLEPVELDMDFPFSSVYVHTEDFASDKENEISGEDLDIDVLSGETLDLAEVVREQLLLEMPVQVFCSEDCNGLCERCGANLNIAECGCGEDDIDPRWAALKNLK